MSKMKRINIDVPEELWKQFSVACAMKNQTKKESIEIALQQYIKKVIKQK